jgi:hypothetical protein
MQVPHNLHPYPVIGDPVSLRQDFRRLRSLRHEDQQRQLRKLYGCSLGEAKEMVASLREN